MKFRNSYHPYAMTTIILWALAFVLTRLALRYFTPFSLGFLRFSAASCAFIPFIIILKMKLPKAADIKWFLAAAASGFSVYTLTFNIGCQTVTASTSSIILATVPVITAILARIFYKERLKIHQWAAIALEFSGVAVLTVLKGGFSVNIGLLWLMASVGLMSVYNMMQRKLTKTYSPLQTSAYGIIFGTIMLSIFLPSSVGELTEAPPMQIIYVLILGVFCGAVAYGTWTKAFSKAEKTSSVSNYMFVTPFLTGLLGIIMANEAIDTATIIGGSIIMAGLLIFNFGDAMIRFFRRRFAVSS